MLTPDHLQTLTVAAQDILHQKPFDGIHPSIDNVAAAAANDTLGRLRVRKLPVGGAFAHAIGSRVIETLEQNPPSEYAAGSGQTAYDQYQSLTSGVERSIGQQVIAELKDTPGTFKESFGYFDGQIKLLWATEEANATDHHRLGKATPAKSGEQIELPTSEELLSGLVADNSMDVTTALIIHQTVQLCRQEGRLPSGEELSGYLQTRSGILAGLAHPPGQVYNHSVLGKELARKHFQRIRSQNNAELGVKAWSKLFKDCLKTGDRPPLTEEMAPSLQQHPFVPFQLFGHCAAQLKLHPLERPGRPEAARLAVAAFFERQGVILQDGSFRLVDYQILRNIAVAGQTILADSDCRAALELLAQDGGA